MLCLAVSAVLFCPVPRANPAVTCCPSLGHAGLAVDWSLILNGERNGAKGNRVPSMYASCVFTASVLQRLPSSSLRYIYLSWWYFGYAFMVFAKKKIQKSEFTMEVGGWVQVSLGFVVVGNTDILE